MLLYAALSSDESEALLSYVCLFLPFLIDLLYIRSAVVHESTGALENLILKCYFFNIKVIFLFL
jgi:hypothetical protein